MPWVEDWIRYFPSLRSGGSGDAARFSHGWGDGGGGVRVMGDPAHSDFLWRRLHRLSQPRGPPRIGTQLY